MSKEKKSKWLIIILFILLLLFVGFTSNFVSPVKDEITIENAEKEIPFNQSPISLNNLVNYNKQAADWLNKIIKDCHVNPKADGLQVKHKRLGWPARLLGIITTPFKYLGLFGWRDLNVYAEVIGNAYNNPVWSTDGFTTIDVEIERLEIEMINLTKCSYSKGEMQDYEAWIRIEIKPLAQLPWDGRIKECQKVKIKGRLKVDHDKFYEVHPESSDDIQCL